MEEEIKKWREPGGWDLGGCCRRDLNLEAVSCYCGRKEQEEKRGEKRGK